MPEDPPGPSRGAGSHELETPWWPETLPSSPAAAARDLPAPAGSSAADDRGAPRIAIAAARLSVGVLWLAAFSSLSLSLALAAAARSLLLIPLVGMAALLVFAAILSWGVNRLYTGDAGSDTSATLTSVLALLFGWLLGAWMLSMTPGAARPLGTHLWPGLGVTSAAVVGAFTLPALAVILGLRSRQQGSEGWLAVRLGFIAAAASIAGGLVVVLLVRT